MSSARRSRPSCSRSTAAHLAGYKCPRSVEFDPELPRDPNGKLYKRRIRERYWQGRTSRIV
jgi:acyl-CoA synthetase (AMP-forming)/AMP-acid ligase II